MPTATSTISSDAVSESSTEVPTASTDTSIATQPSGGPVYVVINPPGDEYIDLQNSFIQTATGFGADAKIYADLYDTNSSISQVNDIIQSGAKGIAIQAFAPAIIGPKIAKAAKAAGVVLIALDAPIKGANGISLPLIKFDDKEMGKHVGEAASKLLIDSGWLKDPTKKVGVLSLEVKLQPFCNIRTENAKAVI